MSKYDLRFLLHSGHFQIQISKDLYWVPVNTIGSPQHSVQDIRDISMCTPQQKRAYINTLYDAVQLFVACNFHDLLDIVVIEENNIEWEHHKPGYYAILTNCGCCASDAAWLRYLLFEKYQDVGYISFSRPNGSGHVFNYILSDGWYYLYDLCPLTEKYIKNVLVESGKMADFLKAKYVTGALLQCRQLESFALFFTRLQLRGGFDHLFFKHSGAEVGPISTIIKGGITTILMPENAGITPLLMPNTKTIQSKFVSHPKSIPDWESRSKELQ